MSTVAEKIVLKRELHSETDLEFNNRIKSVIPVGGGRYPLTLIFDLLINKSKTVTVKDLKISLDELNKALEPFNRYKQKYLDDRNYRLGVSAVKRLQRNEDYLMVSISVGMGSESLAKILVELYPLDYLEKFIDSTYLKRVMTSYSLSYSIEEVCNVTSETEEIILKFSNPNVKKRFAERTRTHRLQSMVYHLSSANINNQTLAEILNLKLSTVSRYINSSRLKRKKTYHAHDFFNRVQTYKKHGYTKEQMANEFGLPIEVLIKYMEFIEKSD